MRIMIAYTQPHSDRTFSWLAARIGRLALAPNVFLALGPLKELGRARTAEEANAAAIAALPFGCAVQVRLAFP